VRFYNILNDAIKTNQGELDMLFIILMLIGCGGEPKNKDRKKLETLLQNLANSNQIGLNFSGNRSTISLSTPKIKKAQEMLNKLNQSTNFPFSTFNSVYSKVVEIEKLREGVSGSNDGDFFSNNNNGVTEEKVDAVTSDYSKSLNQFDKECAVENIDEELLQYLKINFLNATEDIRMIRYKMQSTEKSKQFNESWQQTQAKTTKRMNKFDKSFDEKKQDFDKKFNEEMKATQSAIDDFRL
jgi:hypothetical protein